MGTNLTSSGQQQSLAPWHCSKPATQYIFYFYYLHIRRPGYPTVPFTKLKLPFTNKRYTSQILMENGQRAQTRGALVVLEGLDRSGKTSQSSRLLAFLEGIGFPAESWRFPDRTTGVGRMISSYLASESQLNDRAIHLLFSANRWEKSILMENKLKGGTTLIVDRYSYSGVAFSSAKGLDIDWCKAPEFGLLAPDLVLYLDIPPEKAAERGGYGGERYEQLEFQQKVSEKYQILRDPTWQIIDAGVPMEDVEKQLRELVLDCVTTCRKGKPLSRLWLRAKSKEHKCLYDGQKLFLSLPLIWHIADSTLLFCSDDDAVDYNLGRIREVFAADGDKQDEGFIVEKDESGSHSDDPGENLSDLSENKRVKEEHRNEAST